MGHRGWHRSDTNLMRGYTLCRCPTGGQTCFHWHKIALITFVCDAYITHFMYLEENE